MHCRTPVPRHPSVTLTAVLALPLLAVLGCADTVPPTAPGDPLMPGHPAAALIDGSTGGEFDGFLFLPPLVASPAKGGQSSIPGLAPHAEVCLLDTSGTEWVCEDGAPYRTFA